MSWYASRMLLTYQSQRSIWRQVCTPCSPISCFNLIPCILNISQTIKTEKHKKKEDYSNYKYKEPDKNTLLYTNIFQKEARVMGIITLCKDRIEKIIDNVYLLA